MTLWHWNYHVRTQAMGQSVLWQGRSRDVACKKVCGTYPRLGPIRRACPLARGGEGLCRKGRGWGLLGGRLQVEVHGVLD